MDAMEGCDTLFMVGTNFPYTKYLPEPGQCKVVQIEADPVRAGNRIATEVPMIGDAKETLAALAAALDRKPRTAPSSRRSRRRWAIGARRWTRSSRSKPTRSNPST